MSFTYPDAQSTIFTSQQWDSLRARYKPKPYDTQEYKNIKDSFKQLFEKYKQKKTHEENWLIIYQEIKLLERKYDQEVNPANKNESFCLYFLLQIILLIKHQPGLFDQQIDSSEWDYIVKFWGPVTEKLFYSSGLRLKWEDTHLTLHDTASNCIFKADLRIIHDQIRQRYNVENDVSVTEAAEEGAGDEKFTSDRCKLSIENKTIIDRFLMNCAYVTSVDALQVHGLQLSFINTSLEASGLYVSTQFHQHSITNSLKDLQKYMDLAFELLCFRDSCVSTSNIYNDHSIQEVDNKRRGKGKRPAKSIQDDNITLKQESIRGTWNPPRSTRTPPPAVPDNLWK